MSVKPIPKEHDNNGTYHFVFHNIKVIFTHIPRAGGTWIKRWLYILDNNLKEKDINHNESDIHCREYNRTHISSLLDMTDYFKFAIMRHPYDRLLSLYKRFIVDKLGHWAKSWDCIDITFKEFVERVAVTSDEISDIHITSQYSILNYNDYIPHDFIGNYSNYQKSLKYVADTCNLQLSPLEIRANNSMSSFSRDNIDVYIINKIINRYIKDIDLLDTVLKETENILKT